MSYFSLFWENIAHWDIVTFLKVNNAFVSVFWLEHELVYELGKTFQRAKMVQLWGISSFFSLFPELYFFPLDFEAFPHFYFLETFLHLSVESSLLSPSFFFWSSLLFLSADPFLGLLFHLKLSAGDGNSCVWSPYIFFRMLNVELSLHLTNPLCSNGNDHM